MASGTRVPARVAYCLPPGSETSQNGGAPSPSALTSLTDSGQTTIPSGRPFQRERASASRSVEKTTRRSSGEKTVRARNSGGGGPEMKRASAGRSAKKASVTTFPSRSFAVKAGRTLDRMRTKALPARTSSKSVWACASAVAVKNKHAAAAFHVRFIGSSQVRPVRRGRCAASGFPGGRAADRHPGRTASTGGRPRGRSPPESVRSPRRELSSPP